MAQKKILVYIEGEGGGSGSKRGFNDGEFRKSWRQFLQPLVDLARQRNIIYFQCIPGRGGNSALNTFNNPLPQDKGALRILIVDSEVPVTDVYKPWDELGKSPPSWADDGNCYLMVQCLETWLLADIESLKKYYNKSKKCFNESKLKSWNNLESADRKTLQGTLEAATATCGRPYAHADGNILIALVQRDKLKTLSSVSRLFEDFEKKIEEYAKA